MQWCNVFDRICVSPLDHRRQCCRNLPTLCRLTAFCWVRRSTSTPPHAFLASVGTIAHLPSLIKVIKYCMYVLYVYFTCSQFLTELLAIYRYRILKKLRSRIIFFYACFHSDKLLSTFLPFLFISIPRVTVTSLSESLTDGPVEQLACSKQNKERHGRLV